MVDTTLRAPTGQDGVAVEATGLTKTFGAVRAVVGVDLTIPRGNVFAVLGPNGAGKTTLIRMLATLLRPDSGTARVFGHDIVTEASAVRARLCLTGQFASVDGDLTARENLVLLSRLLGFDRRGARARATELLDAFGLAASADRAAAQLSGGTRRRLDIAASFIVTPDLLFLDEPTTGLDPYSRNGIWDLVRATVDKGTTVVLTTQYLEEADQLADHIAVIDHGTVIANGTRGQLKASAGSGSLHLRLLDPAQRQRAEDLLADTLGVATTPDSDPASLSCRIPQQEDALVTGQRLSHALGHLTAEGIAVTDFAFGQPSLDEVFLTLTGHAQGEQP
jgi:ABC-2 type transport system ATP-binding protein